MPYDDDDDWVGTPPEGHYTSDRARPDFWTRNRPLAVSAFWFALFVLVVVVVILAF